jgi:hypothetical protein
MCRFQITNVQMALFEPDFLELKNEKNFIKLKLYFNMILNCCVRNR